MTLDNLKIVLANIKCCIAELGVKVSDMYSIGNKCANSELAKLKIVIDKYKAIKDYYFTNQDTSVLLFKETFPTGVVGTIPSGWSSSLWKWDAKRMNTTNTPPYTYVDNTSGLAYLEGNNYSSSLVKSNILKIGKKYKVSFDVFYSSDVSTGNDIIEAYVGFGDNFIQFPTLLTTSRITIEGYCKTNTDFSIKAALDANNPALLIDNIEILTSPSTCLTSDQIDVLTHDIMKECDICDCQLNQDN